MALAFNNCKATLSLVDAQQSLDSGLVIVVVGHLSNNGQIVFASLLMLYFSFVDI
jgi:hypothetical protein